MENLDEAVERVQKGDSSAFSRIVEATSARLVRVSARIVGNVTDAEDVVQEAYVRAYRALAEHRFDRRASVMTWLYRIVVNASIDVKRRPGRTPSRDDELGSVAWDGAASAEAKVALGELADLVRTLPDDQRTALILKAIEGLSSAEIAEITQSSEGAVEQRLVRARAALREALLREKGNGS